MERTHCIPMVPTVASRLTLRTPALLQQLELSGYSHDLAELVFRIEQTLGLFPAGQAFHGLSAREQDACRHKAERIILSLHPPTAAYATTQAIQTIADRLDRADAHDLPWTAYFDVTADALHAFAAEYDAELSKAWQTREEASRG